MKKLLSVVLLLTIVSGLNAQQPSELKAHADSSAYTYCLIVGTSKLFSNKVNIHVDFGQEQKLFDKNYFFKDSITGKNKVFNSMIDALNYFGDKGWEFVQAYAITISNQNVYHYLMKKKKSDFAPKNQ